jgi:phosphoribosylformylglycinamidine synthase
MFAGAAARRLGTTGGNALTLPGERPILVANLRERFEGWLPRYMAASRS